MSGLLAGLFSLIVFPGLLFLVLASFAAEFIDRKFCARLQNRQGPPWFQPVADFIKLIGKETVIPEEADHAIFRLSPIIALVTSVTAFFYVPLWSSEALYSFEGDVIVVLYLLTVATLTYFLAGLYSRSVYSTIGAMRSLTQLFAYEVPLFMSVLASALLADSWSLSRIAAFYADHPVFAAWNLMGFGIAMVSLLGKLEKVPFDIPEAETEIVAGSFTEYGGRYLALFRLSLSVEMVVGVSVLCAVFFPFGFTVNPVMGIIFYLLKVLILVLLVSLLRSLTARLRLDQMINFCWKILAPLAFLQVVINLIIKSVML